MPSEPEDTLVEAVEVVLKRTGGDSCFLKELGMLPEVASLRQTYGAPTCWENRRTLRAILEEFPDSFEIFGGGHFVAVRLRDVTRQSPRHAAPYRGKFAHR